MNYLDKELYCAVSENKLAEVRELLGRDASVNYHDCYGVTPLHKAVIEEYIEITDMLIRHKADVNAPDNDGVTPLHRAAAWGKVEIANLLIRNSADVNAPDKIGVTPLHKAAANRSVEIAELLIRNKADVNAPDNVGVTPLYIAVAKGSVEIAELLIRNKADVNALDSVGVTPLYIAVANGSVEIAELLIRNKANVNAPDNVGDTPLHRAVKHWDVKVADALIRNKADINAPDNVGATPLHKAARIYQVDVADLLITNKADINVPDKVGATPLHKAAEEGNVDVADLLIRNKADINVPDVFGATPLHKAVEQGEVEVADLLIKNKADINAPDKVGVTPLQKAAANGQLEIIDVLISNNAEVNVFDNNGKTPLDLLEDKCKTDNWYIANDKGDSILHQAVDRGNKNMVKALVSVGANVMAVNIEGVTPLHKAAEHGQVKVIDVLIRNNAEVNATDNNNATPLHKAAAHRNVEVAEILIRNGAVVNAPDHVGDTPLHKTIDASMAEYLIRQGATVSVANNKGATPLHNVAERGDVEVAVLLIRNKADVNVPDNVGDTPLHKSAVQGYVEVTDLLIRNKADVNAPDNDNATPLHKAAATRNVEVTDILIRNGAVVNAPDHVGDTPLHKTIDASTFFVKTTMVEYLIRQGATVSVANNKGDTPLHKSAVRGYVEVTDLLIRNKADVNAPDNGGATPLHKAAVLGNVKVADLLIRNKADINCPDNVGDTSLHKAAHSYFDKVDMVENLKRLGANLSVSNNKGKTPLDLLEDKCKTDNGYITNDEDDSLLHQAIDRGNKNMVKALVSLGANVLAVNHEGITPLHKAAAHGQLEMIDVLIRNNAEVNATDNNGGTPLHKAAAHGQVKVIDILIRDNAGINATDKNGLTPLHKAAAHGQVEFINILIRNNAEVNATDNNGKIPLDLLEDACQTQYRFIKNDKGSSPLHQAASDGNMNMVTALLSLGANSSAVDTEERKPLFFLERTYNMSNDHMGELKDDSALHKAVILGDTNSVLNLLTIGADLSAQNKKNQTPLHVVKYKEEAELLIRYGADVNSRDINNQTPLHLATHRDVAQILIQNGADVNSKDFNGQTPLHVVNNQKVIEILIKNSADVNSVDINGDSPLHEAASQGKESVVKSLLSAGANISARNNEGTVPYELAEKGYQQNEGILFSANKYKKTLNYLKDALEPQTIPDKKLEEYRKQSNLPDIGPFKQKNEKDIPIPWLVDADEFQRMLSHGEYLSYENRLSLGGPCRAGKSTLASVLIDEKIPLKWNSTDGLVIFFGRNGIDIENKKMVPLEEGERGHEVFAKILRGEPDFCKSSVHETRQHTLALEELGQAVFSEVDTTVSTVKYTQGDNATGIPSTSQVAKKTSSQSIKPLPGHLEPQVAFTGLSTLTTELEFQKLQLQSSILEEIRNQKYKIKIAPSDLIDFGGQKSYDMTHQLFIQHKGSFLLMFDGRFGLHNPLPEYTDNVTAADIIKHWIDSVLTYIEDTEDIMPMIMFAATHRDQCKEDTDKMRNCFIKDIKSMFYNYDKKEHLHLETVYFINGIDKHDAEIQRMTDQVVQFAVKQTSWGQRRPMQWVPLELQISNMRMKNINIITKADLLNVNQLNNDLALEGRQLNDFLLVQHSLGKLMFYNLPGLDNFIIIHPPALVNILRSFVTDEKFFPDEPNLKTILLKMTTTGKISKTELLKLWEQHQFHQYMQDESIKEFVVQLLMHLDILIIPKASNQTNVYLVPCMIKSTRPSHFNSTENQEGNTICLRYTIARHSIPTSLAYKIIGASICAWPLKYEDNKPCLYHKAALVNISQDIELRIWIEDNHVMVVMTNELALIHISPDVAASVQECLTKNLESSLLFHYNSFGKQMKPTKASELYTMEVGIPCGQDVCYTSLQDVIIQDKWICGKEKNHDTRYLRYWTFNKSQTTCGPECKGLNNNEIKTEPSDKHLVRLGNRIGIRLFDQFFINLKMDRKKWESIEYTYAGHSPEGIMSMALVKWKECKLENMDDPTLNDLSEALAAVNLDTHVICQVFRENTKLQDIADFTLQETPGDDVLEELSKHIGNCALQLGIELGVSFHKLQSSFIKFPKDLPGLLEDILKIWKTESKVPTYHSLMMALSRVDGGGVGYLRKHCG